MKYTSSQITDIVHRVEDLHKKLGRRVVISLAGVPGSGKSTISSAICAQLNANGLASLVLPQDGFHYYRKELAEFPNAEEAIFRRGAPFTFNALAFLDLVKKLKSNETLYAPSFDHSLKDPMENDIVIDKEIQVVIIEGNYVSLGDEVWTEIADYVDETWFCEASLDNVRERIIARHLESGISALREEAVARVDGSDLVNARYIVEHLKKAEVVIVNG